KLLSIGGDRHPRQLARCPDVDRTREIHGLIQRARLDRDGLRRLLALVPDARAAMGAERALHLATAVGRPGPVFGMALRHPQAGARHLQRHAEGRGRLLAAFEAVTDIERDRLARALVAQRAALASAGAHDQGSSVTVGLPRPRRRPARPAYRNDSRAW